MRLKGEARKQALAKTQAAAERIRAAGYEVVKVTPTRIKLGPIVLGYSTDAPVCAICGKSGLDQCGPCGRRVCGECQQYGFYSDETCCTECAAELRQLWAHCSGHEFGESYINGDGEAIHECQKCSYPTLAEGMEY